MYLMKQMRCLTGILTGIWQKFYNGEAVNQISRLYQEIIGNSQVSKI